MSHPTTGPPCYLYTPQHLQPSSHEEVNVVPTWTKISQTTKEHNPPPAPCNHFLTGFCKRMSTCKFDHLTANCPSHRPDLPPEESCQLLNCVLRHPKLCLHFMNARCHFGERCLLFHLDLPTHELIPTYLFSALLQSLVENLQKQVQTTKL